MVRVVSAIVPLVFRSALQYPPLAGRPKIGHLARVECEDYTIQVRTMNTAERLDWVLRLRL